MEIEEILVRPRKKPKQEPILFQQQGVKKFSNNNKKSRQTIFQELENSFDGNDDQDMEIFDQKKKIQHNEFQIEDPFGADDNSEICQKCQKQRPDD